MANPVNPNPEPPPSSEELRELMRMEAFQVGHDKISRHVRDGENSDS
jgi:hypothetical protein